MGSNISSPKGKIWNNAWLPQKVRKISNKWSKSKLKGTSKKNNKQNSKKERYNNDQIRNNSNRD